MRSLLLLLCCCLMLGCGPATPAPQAVTQEGATPPPAPSATPLAVPSPTLPPPPEASVTLPVAPSAAPAAFCSDDYVSAPAISADGQWVVFASGASDLVANDRAGCMDLFLYGHQAGTLIRLSEGPDGREATQDSDHPAISGDGSLVIFDSYAPNLVADDTNGASDIFLYHRLDQRIERISLAIDGSDANGSSHAPTISENGRWIAFWSDAGNLVASDEERCAIYDFEANCTDIFVFDRQTGERARIPVGVGMRPYMNPRELAITNDGRFVIFYLHEQDRLAQEGPQSTFVLYDRHSESLRAVVPGDGHEDPEMRAIAATISPDGRWLAFVSAAATLVPGDTNGEFDVFVRDLTTEGIERVSVADDEEGLAFHSGFLNVFEGTPLAGIALSNDGQRVAFMTFLGNQACLDPFGQPQPPCYDLFLRERQAGTTTRFAVAADGSPANHDSAQPDISADGRWVVFASMADNLAPPAAPEAAENSGDGPTPINIFLYDRETGVITRVSQRSGGAQP